MDVIILLGFNVKLLYLTETNSIIIMEKIEKMPYFNCRSLTACFEELCL